MTSELLCELKSLCDVTIKLPLSERCSFRIGGCAELAAFPASESALIGVIRAAKRYGERYTVLGNMTNVLISDAGVGGICVFTSGLSSVSINGRTVRADCGASLTGLSVAACGAGLSGLEFAYGIPGSVGGAVYMNAGAYGGCMSDAVCGVRAYSPSDDAIREYSADECAFGYRDSRFRHGNEIILLTELELTAGDMVGIKAKMDGNMRARIEKQPLSEPSAGSVFKRPEGHYAGALIDEAGLRGYSLGGAKVSEKHAGFIVNAGGASADDVFTLIKYIKEKVFETSGVMLEEEIIFMG